jgi:UDP-N-acetylglucosamine:LPS N-acetylglucosamine transferase
LGPISRFKKLNHIENSAQILVLLSGPEPQRSILENILYKQINKLTHYKWVILRGTESKPNSALTNSDNVVVKNLLDEINLDQLIAQSKLIICRAGYTSIMDFTILNKKAILIPTPGQWEQEYLATWNSKNNNYLFVNQHQLDLKENIAQLIAN